MERLHLKAGSLPQHAVPPTTHDHKLGSDYVLNAAAADLHAPEAAAVLLQIVRGRPEVEPVVRICRAKLVKQLKHALLGDDGAADVAAGDADLSRRADKHAPLDVRGGQAPLPQGPEDPQSVERGEHRGVDQLAAELAPKVRVALEDPDRHAVGDELIGEDHPRRAGADDQDFRGRRGSGNGTPIGPGEK